MSCSDAHFLSIPKPFRFRLRARLLNELVATRTLSQVYSALTAAPKR